MPQTYAFPEPTSDTNAIEMNIGDSLNLTISSAVQLCCDHPDYFTPPFPSGHSVASGGMYRASSSGSCNIWVGQAGEPCLHNGSAGRSVHILAKPAEHGK